MIIGFDFVYNLSDQSAIAIPLTYSNKGSSSKFYFQGNIESETSLNLSYIQLPILLKKGLGVGSVSPSLLVGLEQGYLVEASYEIPTIDGNKDKFNLVRGNNLSPESSLNRYDIGLTAGLSLELTRSGFLPVFCQISYAYSLNEVILNPDVRNNNLSFSIGFHL